MDPISVAAAVVNALDVVQLMISSLDELRPLGDTLTHEKECLERSVADLKVFLAEAPRRRCRSKTASKEKLAESLDELNGLMKGIQEQVVVNMRPPRSPSRTTLSLETKKRIRGAFGERNEAQNGACLSGCKSRAEHSSKPKAVGTYTLQSIHHLRHPNVAAAADSWHAAFSDESTCHHCSITTTRKWTAGRCRIFRWLVKGFILVSSPVPIAVLANYARIMGLTETHSGSSFSAMPWSEIPGIRNTHSGDQLFTDPMPSIRPSVREAYSHPKSVTQLLGTIEAPLPIMLIIAALGISGLLVWYHQLNRHDKHQNKILWWGFLTSLAWGTYSSSYTTSNMLALLLAFMPSVAMVLLVLSDILHALAGVWCRYRSVDVMISCPPRTCACSPHLDVEATRMTEKATAQGSYV